VNDTFVTERELTAHLGPMKADIAEMKADTKAVLAYVNQQKGASSKTRFLSDRRLAYAAIVAGLVAPIGWLHIF